MICTFSSHVHTFHFTKSARANPITNITWGSGEAELVGKNQVASDTRSLSRTVALCRWNSMSRAKLDALVAPSAALPNHGVPVNSFYARWTLSRCFATQHRLQQLRVCVCVCVCVFASARDSFQCRHGPSSQIPASSCFPDRNRSFLHFLLPVLEISCGCWCCGRGVPCAHMDVKVWMRAHNPLRGDSSRI